MRKSQETSQEVRSRIAAGGERLWRLEDFDGLSAGAVMQTLSRLAKADEVQRLTKGVYYRPRDTAFGKSRPNPAAMERLAAQKAPLFPTGLAAASMLGLTTQVASLPHLATSASSVPRRLLPAQVVIQTRRPEAWRTLLPQDAALLDVFRNRGVASELSPKETIMRVKELLGASETMARLLAVARTEPPRVRAMLGALAQELGAERSALEELRRQLNPTSKFDFGVFGALKHAEKWQAAMPRRDG